MNFDIISYGSNLIKNNDDYNFVPFTIKNKFIIKIYENINISFKLEFSSSIKYFLIKTKKEEKIIEKNNTTIQLFCDMNDLINVMPVYYTKQYYENENTYVIKNLNILKIDNIEPYFNMTELFNNDFNKKTNENYELLTTHNFTNNNYLIPNKKNKIIFSLSVIPSRLLTIQFYNNLKKLFSCDLKADYVVLNFCKTYIRGFKFNFDVCMKMLNLLKKKFTNLIINICEDYGPITKILGLLSLDLDIEQDDIIISVDDDWEYDAKITLFYYYCYEIYNCDCIFIDERYNISLSGGNINFLNNTNIFYDNYQNFAYGWLSFSFKFGKLNKLKKFYNAVIKKNENIWLHDDLIITLYYKKYNLNACGISLVFNIKREDNIINMDALKNIKNSHFLRRDLEIYFLKLYKIEYKNINKTLLYIKNYPSTKNDVLKNNILDKVINVKCEKANLYYLSDDVFLLVNSNEREVIMKYASKNITLKLISNNFSNNSVFLVKFNEFCLFKNIYNTITFYDKVQPFIKLYNLNRNQMNEPKNIYRYFCWKYLEQMKKIKLPNIKSNSKFESVLIEFRDFPHIEFLIRNTINKLGENWCHTVICGNLNYESMIKTCSEISPNIKVIKLNYNNMFQSDYSKLLSNISFWSLITGEKVLIYQEDSCIFGYNINDFLEWDYIGAPWLKSHNDNEYYVGNGGFSLRTKQTMIDVINKISINDTKYNSTTLQYMKNSGQTVGPEDVYFTKNMIEHNIGRLADWETARKFSTEWIYNPDSLGGHCFWYSNKNWLNDLFEKIFQ